MMNVVIVGCGAVVEQLHLPALKQIKGIKVEALVDNNLERAKLLQKRFNVPIVATDYTKALDNIDLAIIALPNFLHAPISIDCLSKGIHVFCEKPMSINLSEATKMIRASKRNKKKLAIGLVRRQFIVNQELRAKLKSNFLGEITSFEYQEGFPFNWPIKSNYVFDKRMAGGGVLMDLGAHVIDLIIWFFGQPNEIEYFDNSFGGVESDCLIKLKIGTIKGKIELSRSRTLDNNFKIVGENNNIVIPSGGTGRETFEDGINKELRGFIEAINNNTDNYVSGDEAIKSIKVIDYCYRHKKQLAEPWNDA